jgi:hypothetical protein
MVEPPQRGWNVEWFEAFPRNVEWVWVELPDPSDAFCLNYEPFLIFAARSRRALDFAPDPQTIAARLADFRRASSDLANHYEGLIAAADAYAATIDRAGQDVPPCIYVTKGAFDGVGVRCDGPLVVIEGTARQIARSRFPPRPERALLGLSPTMDQWPYY